MALEFYLNGTQIYPIVNATITERIGTFSDATLPLEINNIKSPFLPMSHLQIRNTDEDNWNFIVISDEVETVSKGGTLFKHNLTIRSGVYENTKHILRNTRFSQPPHILKGSCNFIVAMYNGAIMDDAPWEIPKFVFGKDNYAHNDIKANSRMKIASAKIHLRTDMWEYNVSDEDAPNYHNVNKHIACKVLVQRWDGSSFVGQYVCSFPNGKTTYVLDNRENIFRNLNDNTRFVLAHSTAGADYKFYHTGNLAIGDAIKGVAVTHAELELETYYYNLYDAANILYKQAKKTYNGADSLDLHCMQIQDASKITELQNTIAPEIDFTGLNFYQAIYQLFSYIDAIPVVDANGYLSYEFLNNYDENKVVHNIPTDKDDEKISINDEYYTSKLVANYQNGRQKNAITYPSANKIARVNTKSLGIPTATDYVFRVPKPIDYVDSVIVRLNTITFYLEVVLVEEDSGGNPYDVTYRYKGLTWNELEIADRVLPTDVYESLDDNVNEYSKTYLQSNCLCYSRGGEYIDLLGNTKFSSLALELYKYVLKAALFFRMGVPNTTDTSGTISIGSSTTIAAKQELYYRVTYHGLYDGKMEQVSLENKYNGETYANQESGQVNVNRMGNNLQGLIAKLGNKVENLTLKVSSYGSRMRVGSIWKTDDGEKYIANVVQTTFSTSADSVIINAQFTKNFNMIAQYTKIDQQKRFYEISNELTSKGYETITEYIYLSYEYYSYDDSAIANEVILDSMFGDTLLVNEHKYQIDYATFRPITYEDEHTFAISDYVYLPLHIYGSGNSICFEMDYDSSLDAMFRLTGTGGLDDAYYSKTSLYTEQNGFADKCEIKLWYDNGTNTTENFPYIANPNNDDNLIKIEDLKYFKKPNEIFHLNFAFAFLTRPNNENCEFFVGDKFINDNAIMPNAVLSRELKLAYGDELYSIIDNKNISTHSTSCAINVNSHTVNGKVYAIVVIIPSVPISGNSWALVDENNNMLIASNKKMSEVNEITFYVIPRRNRI